MDYSHTSPHMSPSAASSAAVEPKTVRFQLISPDSPHTTARLPMRVQIYPHDATDSIVTTVKNFYGLYSSPTSSKGVSFEDEAGNTMIARYENFRNNMVVYVRVIEEPALSPSGYASRNYQSPPAVAHGANPSDLPYPNGADGGHPPANGYYPGHSASSLQHFHHLQEQHGEYISRPGSRTSRKRSVSPNGNRGRRSDSASTNSKNRSRSSKNRQQSDAYGPDSMAGYSSGDGAPGSNNGRAKEQQPIGNTDISLENIVEGGRRKRAKFESSELPLFAPPQMPAATSNPSVSPARRSDQRPSLPYVHPGQNPFSGAGALHSPQHYNTHFGQGGVYATPGSDGRRTRASIGYPHNGANGGSVGVLPTPDPTVSSMSEEDKDVAMQLMRLGEISNISYGRTSTSTQDDTFSGRADAASSTGATSDSESESDGENSEDYDDGEEEVAPPHRKQRLDLDGASRKIYQSVEPADDDNADTDYKDSMQLPGLMAAPKLKKVTKANAANGGGPKQARPQATATSKKPKASKAKAASNTVQVPGANSAKTPTTNGAAKSKKANGAATAISVPMSPASLPPSRKLSVSSTGGLPPPPAGPGAIAGPGGVVDEDVADLSSKPRCQRCRKSKKGCDRQRPCGRCRDAGIPAELCISEDEGNGRKGRYGRHMGVPVKNTAGGASSTSMQPPPPPPPQQLLQLPQQAPVPQTQHHQSPHNSVPTAIPSPSHQAPHIQAPIQQITLAPQLPQLQQILPPQVPSQPQPGQQVKTLPALLPPAHISSTPIIAPTIPALIAASSEKNKKRKR
ncbi:C6 finger domain protein [Sporothrix schenckii 1099-18]|uniref:C6 finger domain protein n=1 Tax=Sporothrix schenckii 1099-18 TaxID=1397361 RepID=A0A0F2M535_SPOSC|nr:C6 finger domain protein [Sporothrix schenckii 1099-18]KJR84813.1 C6 finger domain protein [Sporothrix schenckii 1099-18]